MRFLIPGLATTAVFWVVAWSRIPVISEYSYLPLWLGYILTVNGLSELLNKESLIGKMRLNFLLLFAASIPFRWFFEFMGSFVENWHYTVPKPIFWPDFDTMNFLFIAPTDSYIRMSINFSAAVPALLSTIFLVYRYVARREFRLRSSPIAIRRLWLFLSVFLGVISLYLVTHVPRAAFPLVWFAPILLLEPFLYASGYPSLLRKVEKGEWQLAVSIIVASLFTGFCWELWNFYSSLKWIYTIPVIGFWKVFQMPLIAYLFYPLYGLIAYIYAVLVMSWSFGKESTADMLCYGAIEKAVESRKHGQPGLIQADSEA